MNFSSPTGSVFSCPGCWKRVNTDLHRAIVGDGVYLKAQRVRRPVPFNLVQMEICRHPLGNSSTAATQRNTANRSTEVKILFPNLAFERWRVPRYRLIERKHWWGFTTQLHQYGVHGNPVQPSGKGGTATKRVEVSRVVSLVFGSWRNHVYWWGNVPWCRGCRTSRHS
jgi:hypothetical protein